MARFKLDYLAIRGIFWSNSEENQYYAKAGKNVVEGVLLPYNP
jgi:hypothetical protein